MHDVSLLSAFQPTFISTISHLSADRRGPKCTRESALFSIAQPSRSRTKRRIHSTMNSESLFLVFGVRGSRLNPLNHLISCLKFVWVVRNFAGFRRQRPKLNSARPLSQCGGNVRVSVWEHWFHSFGLSMIAFGGSTELHLLSEKLGKLSHADAQNVSNESFLSTNMQSIVWSGRV